MRENKMVRFYIIRIVSTGTAPEMQEASLFTYLRDGNNPI